MIPATLSPTPSLMVLQAVIPRKIVPYYGPEVPSPETLPLHIPPMQTSPLSLQPKP